MFSLICDRINGWVNSGEADDLIRHRAHYDVIVMIEKNLYLDSAPDTREFYQNFRAPFSIYPDNLMNIRTY